MAYPTQPPMRNPVGGMPKGPMPGQPMPPGQPTGAQPLQPGQPGQPGMGRGFPGAPGVPQGIPPQTSMMGPGPMRTPQQLPPGPIPPQRLPNFDQKRPPGAPGAAVPPRQPQMSTGDNRILSRQKLQELVAQVDPDERLDADAEDILMLIAEEFVESVTDFSCKLAKHRKSPVLEVRDVKLYLERNWNIRVPGFTDGDEDRMSAAARRGMNEQHRQRLNAVRRSKK